MSCMCMCHDVELAMAKVMPSWHGCLACQDNVFHKGPVKVTANNIWKIVRRVTRSKVDDYNAYRFDIEFHPDPNAGPNWALPTFSVMVSAHMLEQSTISTREILAQKINGYFKVGSTTSSLPVHLHGYLNTPDEELPFLSQNIMWKQDNDDYLAGQFASPAAQQAVHGHTITRDLSTYIPGVRAIVECPKCGPGHASEIINMVQHLNDTCGYSREQIADWLETLDVDLTFPSEPPAPKQLPFAKRGERLVIFGPTLAAGEHEVRRRRRSRKDSVVVSAHQGHLSVVQHLRGMRGFQYVVLPGTWVHEEIQALFDYSEATEVGDEEPAPVDYSMVDAMKQVWAKQIEYQLTPLQFYGPPSSGEVTITFTKAESSLEAYQAVLGKSIAQWVDQFVFNGKPKGYEILGQWKDGAWSTQAETLLKNLEALKGSEHEQSVLWLSDPTILGEHLPAVKDEPQKQAGHPLLPTSDSAWYTKFMKPSWQKKEH